MRKLILAAICAISLSGCATTGGGTTIEQVQSTAVQICKFLPTAATVAQIIAQFTGGGGIVSSASEIATAICGAVTTRSARRGARPTVRGVVVRGNFVR